ncbi:hypothetical protein FGU65_10195 [Methanoculleus sp. FWC-SCC1]|uniref:Uncharacterized protein n=1 Tax=Methanoculleus frigidifontis TaxID=2584085 RepID=A0ABT8MBE1_9EURY|nr:hypothetical protein [Methanoculleus sp. FWC-SCC1]MDN7025256.1 hypothetical protein [Methanoculleus sp. FWC-SCC1]
MKPSLPFILLLAAAIAVCGCFGSAPTADEPGASPMPTLEPGPGVSFLTLSGTGNASHAARLDAGLYLAAIEHTGEGAFALTDAGGEFVTVVGRFDGGPEPYTGTTAFVVPADGTYSLKAVANGSWTISLERPEHLTDLALPYTFGGTGDGATGLFDLPAGNATVAMTNDGTGLFEVWLYAEDGSLVLDPTGEHIEPLSWHTGAFDGMRTAAVPESGTYLLNIFSDGAWTVEVRV